jgi:hypothetical protein
MSRYLVIVIMDGVRMAETLGTPANIPNIVNLSNYGATLTGVLVGGGGIATETINGHACILTGKFEVLPNDGSQSPLYPVIFQEYLYQKGLPSYEAIGFTDRVKYIASKDKLWCLRKCFLPSPPAPDYNNYRGYLNCGVDGVGGGGYRADADTHAIFKTQCLGAYPPILSMVSYRESDSYAHAHDWAGYINAIQTIDSYIGEIASLVAAHPLMAGNTNFIITSDHGRADPNYWDHGGWTTEERNVMFVAAGPSFKSGYTSAAAIDAIDIANTSMAVLE